MTRNWVKRIFCNSEFLQHCKQMKLQVENRGVVLWFSVFFKSHLLSPSTSYAFLEQVLSTKTINGIYYFLECIPGWQKYFIMYFSNSQLSAFNLWGFRNFKTLLNIFLTFKKLQPRLRLYFNRNLMLGWWLQFEFSKSSKKTLWLF